MPKAKATFQISLTHSATLGKSADYGVKKSERFVSLGLTSESTDVQATLKQMDATIDEYIANQQGVMKDSIVKDFNPQKEVSVVCTYSVNVIANRFLVD